LQYWDHNEGSWLRIEPEDGAAELVFTVSDFYWLRAIQPRAGDVALVPTDHGLFRLSINPVRGSYRTTAILAKPLVAAPGQVGDVVGCLCQSDGHTVLWSLKTRDSAEQLQLLDANVPKSGWSKPVAYNGRLIWLHLEGHLVWKPGSPAEWLRWESNWEPRFEYGGPVLSRDGRLWLLGKDETGYSFANLGSRNISVMRADGARTGFGNFVFRLGHQVLDNPWDAENVEDENDYNALVLPLLLVHSADRRNRSGLVLKFENFNSMASDVIAGNAERDVKLQWIGLQTWNLDRMRVSNPQNFSTFVYDNHLWIHHPDLSQMRGWKFKGDAA
jgi:hypothetical protein